MFLQRLYDKQNVVKMMFIEIDIIREQIPKLRLERIISVIVLEIELINDDVKFILLLPKFIVKLIWCQNEKNLN